MKCAKGVQLKRGIDKQSPWLSAWVNWISTNPLHTGMLSIFSQLESNLGLWSSIYKGPMRGLGKISTSLTRLVMSIKSDE